MRVAPAVVLSPEELERLRHWRDLGPRSPARAERARIVLLAAEGLRDLDVAERLGIHRRTVARWRGRFLAARVDGLVPAPHVVEEGGIPEETVAEVLRAGQRPVAPGAPIPSTRSLARRLGVGHSTVHRLWATHGVRPARLRERFPRTDPSLPLAPWDVVGLFLDAQSAALVVTLHPATSGERTSLLTSSVGADRRAASPARENVETGRLRGMEAPVAGGILRFVAGVTSRVPAATPLHVLAWTNDPRWTRWVARSRLRRPTLHVERVGDRPGWSARARGILGVAGRRDRRDDRDRGPAELIGALQRGLSDYRPGTGAFEWRATAREVARGESAYRLRSELAGTGHPGFLPRGADVARGEGEDSTTRLPEGPDDERLRALARSIVRRYLRVVRGEWVLIDTWTSTLREANAIALEVLRVGARPSVAYRDEATFWAAATEVSPENLTHFVSHRKVALERTDVFISFYGPSDRERFHALPGRFVQRFRDAQDLLYESSARTGARAVQMALGRVSPASARMYGVDPVAWRTELVEANLVDPKVLARRARWLAERLSHPETVRIRHSNGTDLTLRLLGRRPEVSDGRVPPTRRGGAWNLVTLPAGVVVAPLAHTVADGVFRSNQPSSVGLSTTVGEMSGGRWTFRSGRLERFTFDVGAELFSQSYARAPPGKEHPGALSIGLNEKIALAPLLEDQALGTVTLQIGRNDHLGGRNRVPWWAWLYLRGADVSVDGESLVRGGRIVP
jgi:leucyl aminopeptidase (aminopeptidase T)